MRLVILLLDLYAWLVIARALASWFTHDLKNPIVRFLHQATEPILKPLRRMLSPGGIGGIDISPILAIVLIQIAKYVLLSLAYR